MRRDRPPEGEHFADREDAEMENEGFFEEREIAPGLGAEEFQLAARRQFAGSLVVAVLIATAALLIEMRPAHHDMAATAAPRMVGERAFQFAAPAEQRLVAVRRRDIELP